MQSTNLTTARQFSRQITPRGLPYTGCWQTVARQISGRAESTKHRSSCSSAWSSTLPLQERCVAFKSWQSENVSRNTNAIQLPKRWTVSHRAASICMFVYSNESVLTAILYNLTEQSVSCESFTDILLLKKIMISWLYGCISKYIIVCGKI